ncbi:MAG: hypothetical protein GC161_19405 [Planctomycetaceae bacterium]|nr:hypothetical protein [Planctomycetaceae bacterium]
MSNHRTIAVRRSLAFVLDWFVVVLWGGVVFGAVTIVTHGNPPAPQGPWTAQALGLLTMTLPVTLYFAALESPRWRASLGKRALGLVVSSATGERLSLRSALLRNAAKFVPWECGHLLAQQAAFSGEEGLPTWVFGPAVIAFVGPVWWLVALFATGRTPYDRWVAASVAASARPERAS